MSGMIPPGAGAVERLRWVARLLGAGLFLFWGAFFVEHLAWFTDPGRWPPPWVFLVQGLHLLLLVGLLLAWKRELLGGALILAAAVPFFWITAGRNFALFTLATSVPAALWLYCGWHHWKAQLSR